MLFKNNFEVCTHWSDSIQLNSIQQKTFTRNSKPSRPEHAEKAENHSNRFSINKLSTCGGLNDGWLDDTRNWFHKLNWYNLTGVSFLVKSWCIRNTTRQSHILQATWWFIHMKNGGKMMKTCSNVIYFTNRLMHAHFWSTEQKNGMPVHFSTKCKSTVIVFRPVNLAPLTLLHWNEFLWISPRTDLSQRRLFHPLLTW